MFRISEDVNTAEDVDSEAEVEPAVRAMGPDRYHIDQIERDRLPSGHASRRWGTTIRLPGGSVVVEAAN
jgi:hypothetical protein